MRFILPPGMHDVRSTDRRYARRNLRDRVATCRRENRARDNWRRALAEHQVVGLGDVIIVAVAWIDVSCHWPADDHVLGCIRCYRRCNLAQHLDTWIGPERHGVPPYKRKLDTLRPSIARNRANRFFAPS